MSKKLLTFSLISIYFITKLSGLNLVTYSKSKKATTNSNLSVIYLFLATIFIVCIGYTFIKNNLGALGNVNSNNLLALVSSSESYGNYLLAITTSFLQFRNRKQMCCAINEAIQLNNLIYKSFGICDKKIKKLCLVVIKKLLIFLVLCIIFASFNFVGYPENISIIYVAGTFSLLFIFFMNTSLINVFVTSICFSLYFLTILNRKLKSIVDKIMKSDNFDVNELCNEINKLAINYERVVSFTKQINRITEFQILLSTCSSFLNIISQIFFMYAYSIACFKKDSILSIGVVFLSGIIYIMFHSIEMFAISNISYRVMKKIQKTGIILSKIMRADLDDKLDESVRPPQSKYIKKNYFFIFIHRLICYQFNFLTRT